MSRIRLSLLLLFLPTATLVAGQNAAPSSHFVFDDNFEGDIIINQVRVPKDGEALYTYYETLGWRGKGGGYAGIQAHPKAHNYIFSIWDHKEHTAPIKAVYHGPGTLTEKFGGEGTGLKSWNFELGWDVDVWYTLVARAWAVREHTFYGFWVRSDKTGKWTHMVTMDVAAKDAFFKGGNDAFLEDWLETGKKKRTTNLRGSWKRKMDGSWYAAGSGRYSVNPWDLKEGKRSFNFRTNWDGGVAKDAGGEFYYMIAGGADTKPSTKNPSKHAIVRPEKEPAFAPLKIQSASWAADGEGAVKVDWQIDPTSAPQFNMVIDVYPSAEMKGEPVSSVTIDQPHLRSTAIKIPDVDAVHLRLRGTDIFGNEAEPFLIKK